MPQAIPALLAAAKAIAIKLAVAIAANIAINAITRALSGNPPGPEQSKAPIKQPIPPVRVGFGLDRMSGPYLLWTTVGQYTLDVVAVARGASEPLGFYLNDDYLPLTTSGAPLTVNPSGAVVGGPDGRYGGGNVEIYVNPGEDPATAFARVVALSGGLWTTNHRADGVTTVALICKGVKADDLNKVYPNYAPDISVVGRWSRVYDWRADSTAGGDGPQRRDDESTWEWSQNAVVCFVHDEWFNRGQDWDYRFAPALETWTVAADVADEAVPLKAGGTEPRYAVSGWYELNNPPKELRARWLECFDGMMIERGDGAFVGIAGKYVEPEIILDEDRILECGWRRSKRSEDFANKLVVAFKSADHGYTMVEADPWLDPEDIAARGFEKAAPFERQWVTSNGQARRLAKRGMSRLKATYQGFVVVTLSDDGEELETRYLRLRNRSGPPSMFDVVVEVVGITLDLTKRRVRFDVIAADPNIDAWNPATEEGNAPDVAPQPPPQIIAVPVVEDSEITFTGGTPRARIVVTDPERDDYGYVLRWRQSSGDTSNVIEYPVPTDLGATVELITSSLPQDTTILVAVAFMSAGGVIGEFSDDVTLSTSPDLATPVIDSIDAFYDDLGTTRLRIFIDIGEDGLRYVTRWRVTGSTAWTEDTTQTSVSGSGLPYIETGVVQAGALDVEIALVGPGDSRSDWSGSEPVLDTLRRLEDGTVRRTEDDVPWRLET